MEGVRLARLGSLALAFSASLAFGGLSSAQGALERAKEEIHGEDADESDETTPEDVAWDVLDGALDADDPLGALAQCVLLPFGVPRTLLGDDGGEARFAEYPYRDGAGYWNPADSNERGLDKEWSVRPRAEIGRDFDDLERVGFGLQVEHASRFGLDAAWSLWREDLGDGNEDELDLADVNFVYRFAQRGPAAFRAGLGVNVSDDARESELGINSTYGLDLLPGRPFSAGAEIDFGTLGDATQTHIRAEFGLVLERFGLFASFDHVDIDGVELRSYSVGLRAWI